MLAYMNFLTPSKGKRYIENQLSDQWSQFGMDVFRLCVKAKQYVFSATLQKSFYFNVCFLLRQKMKVYSNRHEIQKLRNFDL